MRKTIICGLLSLGIFLVAIISYNYSNINNYFITQADSNSQQVVSDTATIFEIVSITQPQKVVESHQPEYVITRRYQAVASWYRHGKITANGERFDPNGLTVAHKSLPFNTMVQFTNPSTGQSIVARVNDRGPFVRGREFDLSLRSAQLLGFQDRGVVRLNVEILK